MQSVQLWVTVWVFAPAYFSEHLTFIVGLAHHTKVVASFLVVVGLTLVLGLFIRHLRVADRTARAMTGGRTASFACAPARLRSWG